MGGLKLLFFQAHPHPVGKGRVKFDFIHGKCDFFLMLFDADKRHQGKIAMFGH